MSEKSLINSKLVYASVVGLGAFWLARNAVRHRRKINLRGRTVLITGGSRGLGLALSREFAANGARVAICARNRDELDAATDDLRQFGGDVRSFVCDLSDKSQINRLIDEVEAQFGKIDVLVNNAGKIIVGPAQAMTEQDFREAMDLNFWAAAHATLAVLPRMKARGGGRIVNIASIGGKVPVPHLAPYCASKFALVGFSGAMRTELIRDGIYITGVNPGLMRTGSPRHASFKGNHRAEYAWFSIGDALPGMSMGARKAAKQIVDAAIYGDPHVTLGLPAQLAEKCYSLAPSLSLELASLVNRFLPGDSGVDQGIKPGYESESWISRSFLNYLGRRAEKDLNQLKSGAT